MPTAFPFLKDLTYKISISDSILVQDLIQNNYLFCMRINNIIIVFVGLFLRYCFGE